MIVDLMPTDEQAMIAESVTAFFTQQLPIARLREIAQRGGAAERERWSDLAGLGLFGLGIAQSDGGVGYSLAEEVTVAGPAGQSLISPTLLATMIAAHLGEVSRYAEGRRVAFANAVRPAPGDGDVEVHLIDAEGADDLLLIEANGAYLFPADAARDIAHVDGMDETLGLGRARLDRRSASQVAPGRGVSRRCDLLIAAYLSGMAKATLDMAVDYAKVREQFDQPIGGFQAIKHACADMALRAEAAYSQTCYAAALGDNAGNDSIASARLLASDAALLNARANIQIHGGMGFTDESNAHYFLKRAHVLTLLGASRSQLHRTILYG